MSNTKTLLIAAAGTGGHVFPALTVAQAAIDQGNKVIWIGTKNGLENRVVPKDKIEFIAIDSSGFFGRSRLQKIKSLMQMSKSIFHVRRVMKKYKPDRVIGFGGYITMPVGMAAVLTRTPLILHEQNAVFGKSNRYLARFAKRVLTGFPIRLPNSHCDYVGNPVREEIKNINRSEKKPVEKIHLLVVGGSLGAAVFNDIVPHALALLSEDKRPAVWHQAGKNNATSTQAAYETHNIPAKVSEFIEDMAGAYAWADLIICRAGAMTISEVMVAGLPAIFVPFPKAIDDHQTQNAKFLVAQDAAYLIPQKDLSAQMLAKMLSDLEANSLHSMALRAYALRKMDVVEKILQ